MWANGGKRRWIGLPGKGINMANIGEAYVYLPTYLSYLILLACTIRDRGREMRANNSQDSMVAPQKELYGRLDQEPRPHHRGLFDPAAH